MNLIIFVIIIWQILLSIFIYRVYAILKKLLQYDENADLKTILEKILSSGNRSKRDLTNLEEELKSLKLRDQENLRHIAVRKYNPYAEIGGKQSFSVCLLNDKLNGFLLSGLHARDKTRVYLKEINGGQAEAELSDDEKKTVREAINSI